jgi:DMSO/TMAO reductase YedYZ molybdopterin-dependent catalytic subunit
VTDRLLLSPRALDWTILGVVALAAGTGLATLVTGEPGGWWVFAVHGAGGLVLAVLVAAKLWRVRARLQPRLWNRRVAASVLLAAVTLAALATGVAWVLGASFGVWRWSGVTVHAALGVAATVLVVAHLTYRRQPARAADFRNRRTALSYIGLAAAGSAAWRAQQAATRALDLPGARRFTGSREDGSFAGNAFPATSWVADDPDPVDSAAWTLRVQGAVADSLELGYGDLDPTGSERAVLDCTSGWYTVQDWRGVRVADLLDAAESDDDARWVRFTSVTGYRWSLPIAEARDALLATHVGDEALRHGHGFPARLVAPGRRGFQWVKWVESVEVRTRPDYGQWVAIFTSGL